VIAPANRERAFATPVLAKGQTLAANSFMLAGLLTSRFGQLICESRRSCPCRHCLELTRTVPPTMCVCAAVGAADAKNTFQRSLPGQC
jgi:hypothetical protein